MKILADENIPMVAEAFSTLGEVRTISGRDIGPTALGGADVLLVRSITQVNDRLLAGSSVKFVATATIGTDHIDEACLSERGIGFASAPGSNSNSVAEYVVAALLVWAERRELKLSEQTLGVVGVGHVGSKVAAKARIIGMNVMCNDPPKQRAGGRDESDPGGGQLLPLDDLLADCDVLTFHVPLTMDGPDPTAAMINADLLARMRPRALVINASRGGVHDTAALLAAHKSRWDRRHVLDFILDVWEKEPNIDADLLDRCLIGTPHIAGYSYDGKLAGTVMIYEAACKFFGIEPRWHVPDDLPRPAHPILEVESANMSDQAILRQVVRSAYDIEWDDAALRQITELPPAARGKHFDSLRKNYPVRREFAAATVRLADPHPAAEQALSRLGLRVIVGR